MGRATNTMRNTARSKYTWWWDGKTRSKVQLWEIGGEGWVWVACSLELDRGVIMWIGAWFPLPIVFGVAFGLKINNRLIIHMKVMHQRFKRRLIFGAVLNPMNLHFKHGDNLKIWHVHSKMKLGTRVKDSLALRKSLYHIPDIEGTPNTWCLFQGAKNKLGISTSNGWNSTIHYTRNSRSTIRWYSQDTLHPAPMAQLKTL